MGLPNPPNCPHCGWVGEKPDDVASHMAEKSGSQHPENQWSDAVQTLESEWGAIRRGPDWVADPRGDTPDPDTADVPDEPQENGNPTDGNGDTDGERLDENPLWNDTPPWRTEDAARCGECGGQMERLGEGLLLEGRIEGTRQTFRTDHGDLYCSECELLRTESGNTITNVE